ncbi:hypothetical protein MJM04_31595, partial [Salmonella enterica subsp. enterica serovar Cerro]|nr:hypothetical protein [Salmonella enterica subsp. enterica serovar Cerro]
QAVDLFNQLPQNLNDTQRREQSLLAVEIKLAQKDVAGAQALLSALAAVFVPVGYDEYVSAAYSAMLGQIVQPWFYNQLRTEEQL